MGREMDRIPPKDRPANQVRKCADRLARALDDVLDRGIRCGAEDHARETCTMAESIEAEAALAEYRGLTNG